MRKFMLIFMLIFSIVCSFVCGILYTACNAEIHLTPDREIAVDVIGNRWIHAGDHFLWTIE